MNSPLNKMRVLLLIILLVPVESSQVSINEIKTCLNRVTDFIDEKYQQFGFDGTFGLTLAEIQLNKILHLPLSFILRRDVEYLVRKCRELRIKLLPQLPTHPSYMITFQNKLLNSTKWTETLKNDFTEGEILKLGFYRNWTAKRILQQKQAIYKGIKSDKCLREILESSPSSGECYVSDICSEMMLDEHRVDTGYLLTHRLLYLQVQRLQGCTFSGNYLSTYEYTKRFCSYIFKEAITSQFLRFPYHDLFLEQVVLCGMEGFAEFLNQNWLSEIIKWQNSHGCYESIAKNVTKRTSTVIDYGCSDHSTGLAAAALALYYRYFLGNYVQEYSHHEAFRCC